MAYRNLGARVNIQNRDGEMMPAVKKGQPKPVYHYNLNASTQEEFDYLMKRNQKKEVSTAVHPLRRSLGQLTPSNVLTIKGYYDIKGTKLTSLRGMIYRFAKELNLHVETTFSKGKSALLVRLNRNWPVGVDKNPE